MGIAQAPAPAAQAVQPVLQFGNVVLPDTIEGSVEETAHEGGSSVFKQQHEYTAEQQHAFMKAKAAEKIRLLHEQEVRCSAGASTESGHLPCTSAPSKPLPECHARSRRGWSSCSPPAAVYPTTVSAVSAAQLLANCHTCPSGNACHTCCTTVGEAGVVQAAGTAEAGGGAPLEAQVS